jgi:hypothetical protein
MGSVCRGRRTKEAYLLGLAFKSAEEGIEGLKWKETFSGFLLISIYLSFCLAHL